MSLAINYCKELANELRLIAVYTPGVNVSPGDIITFSEGNIFNSKPIGPFKKVSNLTDLNINLETETDKDPYSYVFASRHSVSVSFSAGGNANNFGKGKLSVKFSKEGSCYLSALDCKQTRFKNLNALESSLELHRDKVDWKNCYIVVAVTVAMKALIMQSNTDSASIEVEGDVKALQPIPGGSLMSKEDVNANINLQINGYSDASFIKPWSDNVAVFFQLVRYKKNFFGGWDMKSANSEFVLHESDEYKIEFVNSADLVS